MLQRDRIKKTFQIQNDYNLLGIVEVGMLCGLLRGADLMSISDFN